MSFKWHSYNQQYDIFKVTVYSKPCYKKKYCSKTLLEMTPCSTCSSTTVGIKYHSVSCPKIKLCILFLVTRKQKDTKLIMTYRLQIKDGPTDVVMHFSASVLAFSPLLCWVQFFRQKLQYLDKKGGELSANISKLHPQTEQMLPTHTCTYTH